MVLRDRPRERHEARYSWARTARGWASSWRRRLRSGVGEALVAAIISPFLKKKLLSSF
jgi:hypothetical protein